MVYQTPESLRAYLISHNITHRNGEPFPLNPNMVLQYLEERRRTVMAKKRNMQWYLHSTLRAMEYYQQTEKEIELVRNDDLILDFFDSLDGGPSSSPRLPRSKPQPKTKSKTKSRQPAKKSRTASYGGGNSSYETSVLVFNLPPAFPPTRIYGLFHLLDVTVVETLPGFDDRPSSAARVVFTNDEDAEMAVERWNNRYFNGQKLVLVALPEAQQD